MAIDFKLLRKVTHDLQGKTNELVNLVNEGAKNKFSSPYMMTDVPFSVVQKGELETKYNTLKADISALFVKLP